MKASRAAIGSALFFLLAPGLAAGAVPWWLTRWRPGPYATPAARLAGALVLLVGLAVLLDAFARFARLGRGTPSPTHPTERLIVSGLYRHTRNPMYLAVLAVIVGQALFFGRLDLLVYAAGCALAMHVFVRLYEEPTLERRYREEYRRYRAAVPRWWPTARAWRG